MGPPIASSYRPIRTQTVSMGASSSAVGNAFGSGIHVIRIVATEDTHYAIGQSPTATTSDSFLPALVVEYISISPGEKIAFIEGATGGTAYVTEVSQ